MRDEFISLVYKFLNVFFVEGDMLVGSNLIFHEINTATDRPVYVKQYRIPEGLKTELKNEINELVRSGVVQDCPSSDYNSPVFFVRKKAVDGQIKHRLVVNFQRLNEQIIPSLYPTPVIDDILFHLQSNSVFFTLDLKSGYHQIPIVPKHRFKTAFSVDHPFIDSGSSFQRLLNTIMQDIIGLFAYIYVDDIIIFSKSFDCHVKHLKEVFLRLDKTNLKLQGSKCSFKKKLNTWDISFLRKVSYQMKLKLAPFATFLRLKQLKTLKVFLEWQVIIENSSKISLHSQHRFTYFKEKTKNSTLTLKLKKLSMHSNKS